MAFQLDYEAAVLLDAEELAEGGVGRAYRGLKPRLMELAGEAAEVEDALDHATGAYAVKCAGRRFEIYGPGVEGASWGLATWALFEMVNAQLAGTEFRFYALNGGNDLMGIFLRPQEAEEARKGLTGKSDWPYLPTGEGPGYGAFE